MFNLPDVRAFSKGISSVGQNVCMRKTLEIAQSRYDLLERIKSREVDTGSQDEADTLDFDITGTFLI